MNLGEMLALLIVIAVVGAGLAALVALCHLLFPVLIARARANAERMPVRSALVGLINLAFLGLVAALLASREAELRPIGLVLLTLLLSLVTVGLTAVALLIGQRLWPAAGSPTRQVAAGALLLELAALVPVVGWFAVVLGAGLVGSGATIVALVRRQSPVADEGPGARDQGSGVEDE